MMGGPRAGTLGRKKRVFLVPGGRAAWVWIPGCEGGWMVSGPLGIRERGWRTGLLGMNLEAEIWTAGSEEGGGGLDP